MQRLLAVTNPKVAGVKLEDVAYEAAVPKERVLRRAPKPGQEISPRRFQHDLFEQSKYRTAPHV
jgi:hypothetical protein